MYAGRNSDSLICRQWFTLAKVVALCLGMLAWPQSRRVAESMAMISCSTLTQPPVDYALGLSASSLLPVRCSLASSPWAARCSAVIAGLSRSHNTTCATRLSYLSFNGPKHGIALGRTSNALLPFRTRAATTHAYGRILLSTLTLCCSTRHSLVSQCS
jgi:hypothetical protein